MRCALSAVPVYCLNDEVEQVPLSQSITYSCFGQGPVGADGLMLKGGCSLIKDEIGKKKSDLWPL